MSPKKRKRVLKDSTPSVLVGGQDRSRLAFRLDVREDADHPPQYFSTRARPSALARGGRLFHYISAGSMGQFRRTSADDLMEYRRHVFLTAVGIGALVWMFFYFLPSV